MKSDELKNIKELYDKYNNLLFKNSLPSSEHIDFCVDAYDFCVGYTEYKKGGFESGNNFKIAFSEVLYIPESVYNETLIHEMIHVWQISKLSKERYSICTHIIAHDRNFTCKMNTINLMLERNGIPYRISEVYNGPKLEKDKRFKGKIKSIDDVIVK